MKKLSLTGSFPLVPPPLSMLGTPNSRARVITFKSLCKKWNVHLGGCKKYSPTKLGGTNGKDPIYFTIVRKN